MDPFEFNDQSLTAPPPHVRYNALGLFKSLQHDIALYNAAAAPETTAGQRRYLRKRLLQQMNEFGVRVDPSKQPTFESAELNDLVRLIEKEYVATAPLAGWPRVLLLPTSSTSFAFQPIVIVIGRGCWL